MLVTDSNIKEKQKTQRGESMYSGGWAQTPEKKKMSENHEEHDSDTGHRV